MSVPPPLSRASRPVPPPRASVRPTSWPVVEHTRISQRPQARFGWGLIAIGAFIGAIAAVAVASLHRSAAAPIVPSGRTPPNVAAPTAVVPLRAAEPEAPPANERQRPAPRLAQKSTPVAHTPKLGAAGGEDDRKRPTIEAPVADAAPTTDAKSSTNKASALFGGMD